MSKSRLEWKVGLFVLIGLVLIAVLLLQFNKAGAVFRPTYTISLLSPNTGGLKPRAAVQMSGVQIGQVGGIRFAQDNKGVIIDLRIYKRFTIHKDARFSFEVSGFLGDQFIAITPRKNEGGVFADGDVAQAESPFDLQEFVRKTSSSMQEIEDTARQLREAIATLHAYVLNPQNLSNISTMVSRMLAVSDRAYGTLDGLQGLVDTNRVPISIAVSNLAVFSERINRSATLVNGLLETNGPVVTAAMKNIETSAETVKSLVADAKAGKGPAGVLLEDEAFAGHLTQIASNLSITSSNLNRLGLWGILWERHPPRTNRPAGEILQSPKHLSE